jgi:beta-galactosidase GanA
MVAQSDWAIQIPSKQDTAIPVMSTATPIPHLRKTKTACQLIVKGKPFLMLAGELHNSSLSDSAYMSTVWPNMKAMHVNTLLGSVTWEMIEQTEGLFTFEPLDQVIMDARTHGIHLVLLWFGSFKNALSTYALEWVKRDPVRFPRVHTLEAGGVMKTLELLSPFNERAWEADGRAFAALMRHLREFDREHSTVIMVQMENETGLLGDSRDQSRMANEMFKKPVPRDIVSHLQSKDVHSTFKKRFPHFKAAKAGTASLQRGKTLLAKVSTPKKCSWLTPFLDMLDLWQQLAKHSTRSHITLTCG